MVKHWVDWGHASDISIDIVGFQLQHYHYLYLIYYLVCYSLNYPVLIARDCMKQFGDGNASGRFVPSKRVLTLRNRLIKFVEDHIYPMENEFYKLAQSPSRWTVHPEEERLKELAKKEGLWNLWIPVCLLLPFWAPCFFLVLLPFLTLQKNDWNHEKHVLFCSSIVLRELENYYLMGVVIWSLMVSMISSLVRVSQTLNMDTSVRSWGVQFGLHRC